MKAIFLLTLLALHLSTASAADFEIKGLRIGMSESDFKKLNPKAKCEISPRDPELRKTLPLRRMCIVQKYTLAAKESYDAQFLFYEDRLGAINLAFRDINADDLESAFKEKYGSSSGGGSTLKSGDTQEWRFGNSELRLAQDNRLTFVFVNSEISELWATKMKQLKVKQLRADM